MSDPFAVTVQTIVVPSMFAGAVYVATADVPFVRLGFSPPVADVRAHEYVDPFVADASSVTASNGSTSVRFVPAFAGTVGTPSATVRAIRSCAVVADVTDTPVFDTSS